MRPSTIRGQWEIDRGPQQLAYDAWWHLGHDTMVTSEWGTPDTFENGLVPEILLGAKYGRRLHFWDLHTRKHQQTIDFGDKNQLVFELRPAHDPTKAYGFVNCVISLENLSSSIWTWHRDGDKWAVTKIIEIPAEPADPDLLPPMLKGFGAVPPLVTDIDLSMDDKFLYVACWGTGDLRQYDVSDPFNPKLTGKVRIGGIVSQATHPGAKNGALNGGPQMVEISRDGRRVYFTNSLYGVIDEQFYPGRHRWLDGEARRQAGGRHRLRREILRRMAEAASAASGPAGRRRLLVGFLLLSVSLRRSVPGGEVGRADGAMSWLGRCQRKMPSSFAPSSAKGTMRWHRATAPSSRRSRPWRSRPCSTRCASPRHAPAGRGDGARQPRRRGVQAWGPAHRRRSLVRHDRPGATTAPWS